MRSNFDIGDRVQGLDNGLEGSVIEVKGHWVLIRTQEGFELEVQVKDLVKIPKNPGFTVPAGIRHKKEAGNKRKGGTIQKKRPKTGPVLEVDLHIEKLHNQPHQLDPHQILDYQLDVAKGQMDFAIRKRIQRIVFIHGVGEGVLKAELQTLLRRYDGITYGEADYGTYGMGATAVFIPQQVLR